MANPRELLRRAARNRRAAAPQAAPEPAGQTPAEPPAGPRRDALRPHHATYTALMRSHDRMRTRHLPVQGGDGRA